MNTPSLFSITLGRFIKSGTDSGTIAAECVLGKAGVGGLAPESSSPLPGSLGDFSAPKPVLGNSQITATEPDCAKC